MPVWVSSKEADSGESRWRVRHGQLLTVEGAEPGLGSREGAKAAPSCPREYCRCCHEVHSLSSCSKLGSLSMWWCRGGGSFPWKSLLLC